MVEHWAGDEYCCQYISHIVYPYWALLRTIDESSTRSITRFRISARRLAAYTPTRTAAFPGDSAGVEPDPVRGADRLGRAAIQLLDGSAHAAPAGVGRLCRVAVMAAVCTGGAAGAVLWLQHCRQPDRLAVLRLPCRKDCRTGAWPGQSTHQLAGYRHGGATQSGTGVSQDWLL